MSIDSRYVTTPISAGRASVTVKVTQRPSGDTCTPFTFSTISMSFGAEDRNPAFGA